MIISASRKTDIPAFFSEWFFSQLNAGNTTVYNPYSGLNRIISLTPEDIDCIVFWTKNPMPMLNNNNLDKLHGYNYYFQYTLNDYGDLESGVPSLEMRMHIFKQLSNMIGKDRVVWRFDPLLITTGINVKTLIKKVRSIGNELHPYTSQLVFSFLDMYQKMPTGMRTLYEMERKEFVDALLEMNKDWNLELSTCAEEYAGIKHSSCIDANLINKLFGTNIPIKKDTGQRKLCQCAPSVDIGTYRTCKHKCKYCYAA